MYLKELQLLAYNEARGEELVEATDHRVLGGINNDLVSKCVHPGSKRLLVHFGEQIPG